MASLDGSMSFMLESSQIVQEDTNGDLAAGDRNLNFIAPSDPSVSVNTMGSSNHLSTQSQFDGGSSKPDIYSHTNKRGKEHTERLVLGEKAHLLSSKWYPLSLFLSSLTTVPLLVPLLVWDWGEHIDQTLILSGVSIVLALVQYFAFSYGIYKYREYPLIKARGRMFTMVMLGSALALMLVAYLCVLLYSGLFSSDTTLQAKNLSELPNSLKLPNAFLMFVVRVVQTFFMGVLTGRLAVVYTLFVSKKRVKSFTSKEVNWLFWRPVVILVTISIIALLPNLAFTIAWWCEEEQEWLEQAFNLSFLIAMWFMCLLRGAAFLFYAWKCRHVDLVFSDYAQNYRAGVLDTLLMLIVCIIWTVDEVGLNAVAILQISAQCTVLSYLYDAYLIPLMLASERYSPPENAMFQFQLRQSQSQAQGHQI